jgi:membrane-associated phospholipid phosphatase
MHSLNLALFEALAAGFSPPSTLLQLASAIALWSSWACAAVLAWVAWRRASERAQLLAVLAAGGAASLIAHEIAASIGMPRPFMVGLSPAHVPHGVRAGLPSTHATVMFTMAFMLLWRRPLRDVGLFLLAVAVATGWARIHVGVHFPFDIAAGALLGAGIAVALCAARAVAARLAPRACTSLLANPLRRLAGGGAAPCVVLMFIAAAAWIGIHTPHAFGPSMLEENGPIENGTIQLYLLAVLCFLLVRVEAMSQWDRAAVCVVLLGLAAREAHWLLAHLDAQAHLLRGPAALAAFVPVALAGAWLARRAWSQRRALRAWARRRPEAMTLMTFAAVVGAALVLDQVPSTTPARSAYLVLSFEEVLELCLPVLALLAALQARLGTTAPQREQMATAA